MTVKDLVKLFDSSTTGPSESEALISKGTENIPLGSRFELPHTPISSPARFLSRGGQSNHKDSCPSAAISSNVIQPSRLAYEHTLDITDSLHAAQALPYSGLPMTRIQPRLSHADHNINEEYPLSPLLSHRHTYEHLHSAQRHQVKSQLTGSRQHIPVPATYVFARDAPPLYLPKLDEYLSLLSLPSFCDGCKSMFPPMDKLAQSGKSLDDLETGFTVLPAWRNRKTIFGGIVNIVLGFTGSSALASFYSLQGLLNTVQIFALILRTIVPVGGQDLGDKWRKLFLGTIPNILALNFASTLTQSLVFLIIFMAIAASLLYYFYRSSSLCDRYEAVEGFQPKRPKGSQWGVVIVTFLLTVIYLPLSTMAVHVLVWSQDLWVVPNPYINATSFPPSLPPLGSVSEYREPLDFCWTTTMKRNQLNYAPIVVVLAAVVFVFLTVWFPIALHHVIKVSVPKIDNFTELGRVRNNVQLDAEYHRLLTRDQNPFAFLYGGFRRGWGTYESIYLGAKLSTLFIIAVLDVDNCLFRSFSRSILPVIRQILLLLCAIGFFMAQCTFAPFLDPVNNASEWTSRLNYLTTSTVALAVTLNIPAENVLNTYVLYTIYIVTYGLSFYFTIINLSATQRLLKRFTRRIDFSIDIFSPRLDVSPSSPHTKRRIWQESITTLFLTEPGCAIPPDQTMIYDQARDSEYPPYLLGFSGTPGERHIENLKILREVGTLVYSKAVALTTGPDYAWYRSLEEKIQHNCIGPDCYWRNPSGVSPAECINYFGNAWWIPFPPTLVLRYDDGPLVVLKDMSELELYISQNLSPSIRRRRLIRLSLRALEGQVVQWPYEHITPIGSHSGWFGSNRFKATKSIHYRSCRLLIKRRGHLLWNDISLGSGFDVQLHYTKKVCPTGDVIGLNDDYELTAPLARFLQLNRPLIDERLPLLEKTLSDYRHHHRKTNRWKKRTLTYAFLKHVYDQPSDPAALAAGSARFEQDPRVQHLFSTCEARLRSAYQRWAFVSSSEARTWWYIFWDDLWRRNHDTMPGLTRHETDFSPYFPSSIAYTPVPRAVLENFLAQRGLFSRTGGWNTFFTPGFLNKIYLRLNDSIFRSSSGAIMFHIGNGSTEREMMDVDIETHIGQPSSIGTGGGTDHDNSWIQTRPKYRWEGILSDPPGAGKTRRKLFSRLGAWFGLTPTWKAGTTTGVSLDVKLEKGRFVLSDLDDDEATLDVDSSANNSPDSRYTHTYART